MAALKIKDFYDAQTVIANAAERDGKKNRNGYNESWTGSKSFTGTKDIPAALQLAREGWPEGLKEISAAFDQISAPAELDGFGFQYDLAGDEPDVGRYLAGDPENMICWTPQVERKAVCFEVSWSYSAGTDKHQVANRGAALAALVDQLERTGRRVEIRITMGIQLQSQDCAWTFLLKRAQDVMSLELLAFWLMHQSAFRRLGFAAMEAHDHGHDIGWGYGTPITAFTDPDAIQLRHLDYNELKRYTTPAKALETVKEIAREAGIEIE